MKWNRALASIWMHHLPGVGPVTLGVKVLMKALEFARNLADAVKPLREPRIIGNIVSKEVNSVDIR
jgi:hypothetical protein